jgi:hypothetical protein
VALGGSAFAAATIGTSDIKDGAVTKHKLHDNAVNSGKVVKNSLAGRTSTRRRWARCRPPGTR